MWQSYATGLIAVALLAAGWVGVQVAWRKAFPRVGSDPDVLALRSGCGGGCGCAGVRCAEQVEQEEGRPETAHERHDLGATVQAAARPGKTTRRRIHE